MYEKYMEEQRKLEELNPKKKRKKYTRTNNQKQDDIKEDNCKNSETNT